jgi:hypothetical protein
MSDGNGNLIGGEPVQAPQQVPMQQFECVSCHKPVVARSPMPQIFNGPTVSGLVFAHERVARCPSCQTPYIPMIGGITPDGHIQMMWTPITQQGPAIVKPSDQELAAVAASKIKM